jgi:colanic acid/amylovoran biosynthesis glycosyltransferase
MRADTRTAIVCLTPPTETFIRAHAERLTGSVVVSGTWRPEVGGRPVLSWPRLAGHKAWRMMSGADEERQRTDSYVRAFRLHRVAVVLAEYGPAGVYALPACRQLGIPLVAHFHGYDASHRGILEEYAEGYDALFHESAAIIGVSRAMCDRLVAMGAPAGKVHHNSCGVDCERFAPGSPASAPPVVLSVGRFTAKKAPDLVLRAFATLHRACPEARLRMAGDGPLLGSCRDLADTLGIADAVTFLGAVAPEQVAAEMRGARAFVQHSIEAPSGDCEGTPVSVLEAGASALPVVATFHGGIPDVVVDGATGYLVAEHDTDAMAAHLERLMRDPALAGALGAAGRRRIRECFSLAGSLRRLREILDAARRGSGPRLGTCPSLETIGA